MTQFNALNVFGALQAGQDFRDQQEQRNVLAADRQRQNQLAQSQFNVQAALATGDRQGARQAALGSRDAGTVQQYREAIAAMGAQERARRVEGLEALGGIGMQLMQMPYEQRASVLQSPQVLQVLSLNGLTPEQAASFDPTDQNIQSILYTSEAFRGEMMQRQRPTTGQRDFERAQTDPAFRAYQLQQRQAGAPNVVVEGDRRTQVGTIPQGYQLVQAPGPQGGQRYRMEPIPGGPADLEGREDDARRANASGVQRRAARTVLDEVANAMELLEQNPGAAGRSALIARFDPESDTSRLQAAYETLQANLSFDRLQEMRANSPTGGALGNVTERELDLLSAATARLNPTDPADVQRRNLARVREIYTDTIKGSPQIRMDYFVQQGLLPSDTTMTELEQAAAQRGLSVHQALDLLEERSN